MKMKNQQKIVVVGTGGTISSRYDAAKGRVVASQNVEDIVAMLPDRSGLPSLEYQNFSTMASFEMTIDTVLQLVKHLDKLLADPEVAGVVVAQGTDTMEETSFLADLLIPSQKPVVFTGAQLPHDHPQTDGPRNILDSIRAASSADAVGLGAMVCFNGQLHAARDVTKVHTSALETFQSFNHGALGDVDGQRVIISRRTTIRLSLTANKLDKRVDLIRVVLGLDGRSIDSAVQSGVDGLVVEAFGRGNSTTAVGQAVSRASAAGVPVIVTSRCPVGRVEPIYGSGGGGGRDLQDAGAIFAGDLKGSKARILLIVALSDQSSKNRLPELFRLAAP
jgi:L-asparaginase